MSDPDVKAESLKLSITDKFPSRLELGLVHQAANKFGITDHTYRKVCACCDHHVHVVEVGCCTDLRNVGIDPGITVMFNFIKMVVVYLLMLFFIGSAYNLYTNFMGHQCGDPNISALSHCVPHPILLLSPVNKLFDRKAFDNMEYTTLFAVLASIVFFVIYRKIHYDSYMTAQEYVQNQEEFTLYVSNIPVVMDEIGSTDYEAKIKNLLTGHINNWIAKNQNPQLAQAPGPNGGKEPTFPRIYKQYIEASNDPVNRPYN